jgi:hypothetical protein
MPKNTLKVSLSLSVNPVPQLHYAAVEATFVLLFDDTRSKLFMQVELHNQRGHVETH